MMFTVERPRLQTCCMSHEGRQKARGESRWAISSASARLPLSGARKVEPALVRKRQRQAKWGRERPHSLLLPAAGAQRSGTSDNLKNSECCSPTLGVQSAGLERGGDFSFCTHGHVLEARDGDVFIFNPLYHHSCTEPHPRPQGSRLFISFYCKKDVVTAAALSAAIKARKGNAPLVLNL